jgi:TPP-dependent pyruvate/acetoin dehydrogenase alpha subunit
VSRARLAEVRDEAVQAVGAALERALAYADPDPASRFDHVFA